jgi:hypothetical protein
MLISVYGRKEPEPGGLGVVEVPKTMLSKSDRRTHGEHAISLIQFSPLISNTISIWNILPQSIAIPIYASECTGGQILNFQNTFNRACDEIKMEIQTTFLWKLNNLYKY